MKSVERPVAVVVSAMSKITDLLLETMRRAELATVRRRRAVEKLLNRHLETCDELLSAATPPHAARV